MSVSAYIKYGGICSKAKAMYAKRLRDYDYNELLSRKSVGGIVSFLRQTAYADILPDRDEQPLHRRELEALLKQALQSDLRRLKYFAGSDEKIIMDAYFSKNELQYILTIVRYLGNRDAMDKSALIAVMSQTEFFSPGMEKLVQADDYAQFLSLLEDTPYAGLFKDTDFSILDYAAAEAVLTTRFYSLFFAVAQKYLSTQDSIMLSRQIGTVVDLKNISCILRLKRYFPAVNINKYMLPFGKQLRKERLTSLIQSPDFFETLKELCPGYCKYFSEEGMDERKDQLLYDFDRSVLLSAQPSVSVVLAYLTLKDTEIKNTIHIIEGIRYGNAPESIKKRLVGVD